VDLSDELAAFVCAFYGDRAPVSAALCDRHAAQQPANELTLAAMREPAHETQLHMSIRGDELPAVLAQMRCLTALSAVRRSEPRRFAMSVDGALLASSLTFLDLTRCNVHAVAPLRHLVNLETLVLDRNPIGTLPPCVVGRMRRLRRLSLRSTDLGNLHMLVGTLSALKQLRVLDLQLINVVAVPHDAPLRFDEQAARELLTRFADSHLQLRDDAFERRARLDVDFRLLHDVFLDGPLFFDFHEPPAFEDERDGDNAADTDDSDLSDLPPDDVGDFSDDSDASDEVPAAAAASTLGAVVSQLNNLLHNLIEGTANVAAISVPSAAAAATPPPPPPQIDNDDASGAVDAAAAAAPPPARLAPVSLLESPVCWERSYRFELISSLPQLTRLDGQHVCEAELEWVRSMRPKLYKGERGTPLDMPTALHVNQLHAPSIYCQRTRGAHRHAAVAARVALRGIPTMRVVRLRAPPYRRNRDEVEAQCDECGFVRRAINAADEYAFSPRQFEYCPHDAATVLCGTNTGEILLFDRERDELRGAVAAGEHDQVLAMAWLNRREHANLFVCGSSNGALRVYDANVVREEVAQHTAPRVVPTNSVRTALPSFPRLTSVACSADDRHVLVSGYSHSIELSDLGTGALLKRLAEVHRDNVNVLKFMHHDANVFATSSFDGSVKLWDLRTPTETPVWRARSSDSVVMCCFSQDDKYLMSAAVDNEVRIYNMAAPIRGTTRSRLPMQRLHRTSNYTRAYFMNGSDYAVVGSCEQRTVRIMPTDGSAMLRDVDVSLATEAEMTRVRTSIGVVPPLSRPTTPICQYSVPLDRASYVQSLRAHVGRDWTFMALTKTLFPDQFYYLVEVDLAKRPLYACEHENEARGVNRQES
jgi:hypothetical protein